MSKLNLTELKKFEEVNKERALTLYGQGGDLSVSGSEHDDVSTVNDHSSYHDHSQSHDSSDCCDY